jgi:hypothetical protein
MMMGCRHNIILNAPYGSAGAVDVLLTSVAEFQGVARIGRGVGALTIGIEGEYIRHGRDSGDDKGNEGMDRH